jgi:uncharacterized membrane protein
MTLIKQYFCIFIPMLIIDSIWLLLAMNKFYKNYLGYLLSPAPILGVALLFYSMYSFAVWFFIIKDKNTDLINIFFSGLFFGFIVYSAYDLTNQATIKDWPVIVTIVDMAWGAIMTGSVSVIAVVLMRFFTK